MAQPTLTKYYPVAPNPSETKNQEKPLETEEGIVFSAVTNDSSNDNSTNTTHTIWPEEVTNTGLKSAPADDMQQDSMMLNRYHQHI